MDIATDVTPVITGLVEEFGGQALIILVAVIGLGAGLFFLSWAYRKIKGGLKGKA